MTSKMPSVSVVGVGGKNRFGFQPLPNSEPPVLAAARKSRADKNRKLIKIAAVAVIVCTVLAGLASYLLTSLTTGSETIPSPVSHQHTSREMNDKLVHIEKVNSVAHSNSQFAMKMYHQLYSDDGNIIMSPFSVSAVMAMLSAGAGGSTLEQIMSGMNFPKSETLQLGYSETIPALRTNENFTLEAANSVFVQSGYNLLPTFVEKLHQYFHASIQSTDFSQSEAAARLINDWVSEMTRDNIKDLISSDMLNSLTRLVLVNAIYFKGDWANKFDSRLTKPNQDFNISPDKKVQVSMMKQQTKLFWAKMENYKMLELPYKGDRVVMEIILPNVGVGLDSLEEKLDPQTVFNRFEELKTNEKVKLELPKFKIEQTIPLPSLLSDLGMSEMFGNNADFSGIDGTTMLYVSDVIQKAVIEVNEEGAEAAAATAGVMMMRSMPAPPAQFTVDRPFLFLVRDKLTGMLLFQGRVTDPTV